VDEVLSLVNGGRETRSRTDELVERLNFIFSGQTRRFAATDTPHQGTDQSLNQGRSNWEMSSLPGTLHRTSELARQTLFDTVIIQLLAQSHHEACVMRNETQ